MADQPHQVLLPLEDTRPTAPRQTIGGSSVSYTPARSILTESTGFMDGYDYTLNPYSGCTFGCSYCYAAFFVRDKAQQDTWGQWVRVKDNALELLQRWRKKPLHGKTIYMSSVTDPYQPLERDLLLTRSLLEELANYHKPRLVIQTRSQLVVRDLDLLQRFGSVQVNMTVTTDDEAVRKAFEPHCSSIPARLKAIADIQAAGVATCITMTPLLPVADATSFAERLLATGVEKFVVQPFHPERGKFVAGTRDEALALCRERGWTAARYREVLAVLRQQLPQLAEGKDGFAPI
ncbi:MAG: radical SAM protein [Chloroflexaceae bacterium]|jgi:DNA repair photolyase|nr:radical SAM protein [Chloroflexaceae bacterium]